MPHFDFVFRFQGSFWRQAGFLARSYLLPPRFLEAEAKQPAKTMTLFLHTNVVVWEAREHCSLAILRQKGAKGVP